MNQSKTMHRKLNDCELTQPTPEGKSESAKQQRALRCAACGQPFLPTNPKLMPFCSLRCQQIDLAGWLNEENGLPWENDKFDQNVASDEDPEEV